MQPTMMTASSNRQPAVIRIFAYIISYVFHPLFIATYVTAYLVYIHPYAFIGLSHKFVFFKVLSVFFNTAFAPGFAVFLMWRLKLINSMHLHTQKERIIPYAVTMIFYFWAWYVVYNQPENPAYFVQFMLGCFIGVIGAWLLNIYTKTSMHATAMGGLVLFFLLQSFGDFDTTGYYFSIAVLVAGLVCTARLLVSNHTTREIVIGFITGVASQLIAHYI